MFPQFFFFFVLPIFFVCLFFFYKKIFDNVRAAHRPGGLAACGTPLTSKPVYRNL